MLDIRAKIYAHPGQVILPRESSEIIAILGSSVAVCLYSREHRIGGMTHFILPDVSPSSTRFGNVAISTLIDDFSKLGCIADKLIARVFGGGCMLEALQNQHASIGARNVEITLSSLKQSDIQIVEQDTGGSHGRKLTFISDEGTTSVKTIERRR